MNKTIEERAKELYPEKLMEGNPDYIDFIAQFQQAAYIAGATEAQDDWTQVDDGLPEEDKAVQVYVPNLYWLNHIAQGYVINNQWKIKYDNLEEAGDYPTEYVTHWRNLPSPPSNDKPKDEPIDNELGLCVECKKRNAVRDYNGHKHYVCEPCYKSLDREFEEEYR